MSFHFILDNYATFHKKEAWSRGTSEVSGAGGPGFNSPMVLGGSFQICELGELIACLVVVFGYVEECPVLFFFFKNTKKNLGGFSKMRKRSRVFRN